MNATIDTIITKPYHHDAVQNRLARYDKLLKNESAWKQGDSVLVVSKGVEKTYSRAEVALKVKTLDNLHKLFHEHKVEQITVYKDSKLRPMANVDASSVDCKQTFTGSVNLVSALQNSGNATEMSKLASEISEKFKAVNGLTHYSFTSVVSGTGKVLLDLIAGAVCVGFLGLLAIPLGMITTNDTDALILLMHPGFAVFVMLIGGVFGAVVGAAFGVGNAINYNKSQYKDDCQKAVNSYIKAAQNYIDRLPEEKKNSEILEIQKMMNDKLDVFKDYQFTLPELKKLNAKLIRAIG